MRTRTCYIILLLVQLLTASAYTFDGTATCSPEPFDTTSTWPVGRHLSLLIAGDLMQHMPQIKSAKQSDGSYNYGECFAGIKAEVERADVAIANFETTLAGQPYSGYPQFSAPDDFLSAVQSAGFDIMLTANNH